MVVLSPQDETKTVRACFYIPLSPPRLDPMLLQSALRLPSQEPGVLEFEVMNYFHGICMPSQSPEFCVLVSLLFCSGMLQTQTTHPRAHPLEVLARLSH